MYVCMYMNIHIYINMYICIFIYIYTYTLQRPEVLDYVDFFFFKPKTRIQFYEIEGIDFFFMSATV